ncbi:SMI1/KNR4 family protein [Streptomyces sp. NPDC093546]|uniref:SMI1/KNR4 family protein n=1 Tax=Streptomyces sp. NPDC093546 TaxID=3366040 RepID=UPI003812DFBC
MNEYDDLLERVSIRAAANRPHRPPVTADALTAADERLGFPLHPLLAALYWQAGDGGFGPEYTLFPLTRATAAEEDTVVDGYLDRVPPADADTWRSWPKGVVPILARGCAMIATVDCLSEDGTVLVFDPNAITGQDLTSAWFVDAGSLAEWLETWLAGSGWYEGDMVDEEFDMPLWADAASRLKSVRPSAAPQSAGIHLLPRPSAHASLTHPPWNDEAPHPVATRWGASQQVRGFPLSCLR